MVNFGMVKAFEAIGTLGGIKTLVVEDLTILVVVMVIGESLKLLLRLVNGGLGLIPDPDDPAELESSEDVDGRLAAFLNDVIQLFRMPSVMAEKIILFPSNV